MKKLTILTFTLLLLALTACNANRTGNSYAVGETPGVRGITGTTSNALISPRRSSGVTGGANYDSGATGVPRTTNPNVASPNRNAPRATKPRAVTPRATSPNTATPRTTAPSVNTPNNVLPRGTIRDTVSIPSVAGETGNIQNRFPAGNRVLGE